MKQRDSTELKETTSEANAGGLAQNMWAILKENKKWWLLPMLTVFFLFVLGVLLLLLSNTSLAPFIYQLF